MMSARMRVCIVASVLAALAQGAAPVSAATVTEILDPSVLREMEAHGYSFAAMLGSGITPNSALLGATAGAALRGDARFPSDQGGNRALHGASNAYRSIVETISVDVKALRSEMAANGRKLFEVTDDNIGRIMDLRWLTSPVATYKLAAVVNRLDRRDFESGQGCGEVRFIYRLAYDFNDAKTKRRYASRLPVNFNVVHEAAADPGGGCKAAALLWQGDGHSQGASQLIAGPLAKSRLKLKQIELNAQIVRFPSGMETEFGGQAVYLMRIFGFREGTGEVYARPLENTPDAPRIASSPALREKFVAALRAQLDGIDTGVFKLPDEFLATKALSFSTFGSVRAANHPYDTLLKPGDIPEEAFKDRRLIRSRAAFMERLNNTTCMGCHQSNATAGFHIIGHDDASTNAFNRVKVGISPHFHAETIRRTAYVNAFAEGREPDRFRPLSSAPPATWQGLVPAYKKAGAGMPCLPDSEQAKFGEAWSCSAGLACKIIATAPGQSSVFGQCVVREEKQLFSGHPCIEGTIQPGRYPYLDRFKIGPQFAAFAPKVNAITFNCREPKLGVPGGAAYRQCTGPDREFAGFKGGKAPAEICGFAGGKAFDNCVATNNFAACMSESIVRGNRPTCGRDVFCREDYMCQALPADLKGADSPSVRDFGYCSPTYFLFQMRIDGHPDPDGKL